MDHFFYPHPGFGTNVSNTHRGNDSSEINFTPLFRLLDDFGRYSSGSRPGARASPPTFQPKFDVRETDAAYELHGELPGARRENVHIEFTDPQTVMIRGRIERSHTASTPTAENNHHAGAITEAGEEDKDTKEKEGVVAEAGEEKQGRVTPPLKASVQDETEAEAEERGTGVMHTPGTSVAETVNNSYNHVNFVVPSVAPKKAAIKYWITERSIGEFTRSFTLPARVEQEGVAANLQDGILTVVVPKSKKHEARRILVA